MLEIAIIIAPLFLLISLGYLSIKTGLVKTEALPSLGNIVLYFAMPAVVISSVGQTKFGDLLEPWFLLAYALASLSVFGFALLINRLFFKSGLSAAAIQGMGMSAPNSMFVGFPLLILVFPDNTPTAAFVMAILVENVLTLPLAMVLLEVAASRDQIKSQTSGQTIWKTILLRLIRNPLIVAIVVGVFISLLNIDFPSPIAKTLQMLSQMSAALALFFIGITLANNHLQKVNKPVSITVFGKLILHPALAALFVMLLPDFDPVLQVAVVILAASPMITIYPIIGERYGHRRFCINTLVLSMLLSFFTLIIVLDWVSLPMAG